MLVKSMRGQMKIRRIHAGYNMYHNSIAIITFDGCKLRIDCNEQYTLFAAFSMMNARSKRHLYNFAKQVLTKEKYGSNLNKTSHEADFTRTKRHVCKAGNTMKNKGNENLIKNNTTTISGEGFCFLKNNYFYSVEKLCCLKEMEDKQYEAI